MPASRADYIDAIWHWMPYVVGLVILGAFLVLTLAFRSPVVAAKAVLLNLFSVSAAFGLATLVFIDGTGGWLIGVETALEGVFPAMPLIVFCAVFGVSMDYEVFLISRIAAARRTEDGETAAIVRGISETGMVITFAAAIMLIVCASFTATGFLPAKMLGFTLAAAVFFDATIVRILMSPALMRLAGRWNWWPRMQARPNPATPSSSSE
jgi:RND superfamily putative drug exporter